MLHIKYGNRVASCELLPGQQCTTLAGSSCLTIRCFFIFGTVPDLTQEHLAATVMPPKWRDSSSQNDDIDAGRSAAASHSDQYSRSVLSCTSTAARCLVGFINGIQELRMSPAHLSRSNYSTRACLASNVLELFHSRIAWRSANKASRRTL
jgi:hypothetical protein